MTQTPYIPKDEMKLTNISISPLDFNEHEIYHLNETDYIHPYSLGRPLDSARPKPHCQIFLFLRNVPTLAHPFSIHLGKASLGAFYGFLISTVTQNIIHSP